MNPTETIEAETSAVVLRDPSVPPPEPKPQITAAQAKVEAVAALTLKAYERAGMLDLTPEETAALQADFPDEAFKPGAAGKEHLIYIEHAFLRDRLNSVIGCGKWAIVPRSRWVEEYEYWDKTNKRNETASRVYVEAMLVVRGCFVAENVGDMTYYPKNASTNYGDAVRGATTQALRRCCADLGIGLQAWKKDWCEGWWQRRRQGGRSADQGARPRQAQDTANAYSSAPPDDDVPMGDFDNLPKTPPTTKPSTAPKPATVPPNVPPPTDESRTKMLAELKAGIGGENRKLVDNYFNAIAAKLETEPLEVLQLTHVPATAGQMRELGMKLAAFERGDKAEPAFPPHPLSWFTKAATKPEPAKVYTPTDESAKAHLVNGEAGEWFWNIIIPIPPKGVPKVEYLKHPQTIKSLYELRHGSDDESQAARQRLFGFVNFFEPKGWEKRDGTKMPASEADHKFRRALDAFKLWREATHPNEKL